MKEADLHQLKLCVSKRRAYQLLARMQCLDNAGQILENRTIYLCYRMIGDSISSNVGQDH